MNQTEAEEHASHIIAEALKEEFLHQLLYKNVDDMPLSKDAASVKAVLERLKPRIAQLILDKDRLEGFYKNRYESLLQELKLVVERSSLETAKLFR